MLIMEWVSVFCLNLSLLVMETWFTAVSMKLVVYEPQ